MSLSCNLFLVGECCIVLSLVVNCLFIVCLGEHNFLVSIGEKAGKIPKKKESTSSLPVTVILRLASFTDISYLSLYLGVLDNVRYLQSGRWNRGGDRWTLLIVC